MRGAAAACARRRAQAGLSQRGAAPQCRRGFPLAARPRALEGEAHSAGGRRHDDRRHRGRLRARPEAGGREVGDAADRGARGPAAGRPRERRAFEVGGSVMNAERSIAETGAGAERQLRTDQRLRGAPRPGAGAEGRGVGRGGIAARGPLRARRRCGCRRVIRLLEYRRIPHQTRALSRKNILMRDRYTCQYCHRTLPSGELTLDHVIPRSRAGESAWENLVACCHPCNNRKGSRTPEEAGMKLARQPRPVQPAHQPSPDAPARQERRSVAEVPVLLTLIFRIR